MVGDAQGAAAQLAVVPVLEVAFPLAVPEDLDPLRDRRAPACAALPANASGVLICQGGDFGGWTFYMLDGRPAYTYNWVGLEMYTVSARQKVPAGRHTITFDFAYEGGRGGGGTGTISRDGVTIGEGAIKRTNSNTFGIDESADVGVDENTPVYPPYKNRDRFTGKIAKVTIETFPGR